MGYTVDFFTLSVRMSVRPPVIFWFLSGRGGGGAGGEVAGERRVSNKQCLLTCLVNRRASGLLSRDEIQLSDWPSLLTKELVTINRLNFVTEIIFLAK